MRREEYIMSVEFSAQEMQEMEEIIRTFYKVYKVKCEIPVDIFKLASDIGFDVRGTEFRDNLEGLILVNENNDKIEGFNSNKIIAYDCSKDIENKKFIVAHELAHYIEAKVENLNTKIVVAARDHAEKYSNDVDEQRKDYIAASILIPREDLLKKYPEEETEESQELYKEIANKYNVSVELAERRLHEVYNG